MPIQKFPDPHESTEEGIVALGGDLRPETLLMAYRQGIFPWPIRGLPLPWFCPPERGILEFERLHIPRSLARARRRALEGGTLHFTIDRNFTGVITHCAQVPRADQPGTWITPSLKKAYIELHRLGHAHSVEAWEKPKDKDSPPRLVGGIYGVDAGGAFAGESMFFLKPYASKLALLHLIDHLRSRGLDWMDIQMVTPHMEALGAREISRDEFLEKLAGALKRASKLRTRLFDPPPFQDASR